MSERRRKFHPSSDPLPKSSEYEQTKIPPYSYKPTATKPSQDSKSNERKTVLVENQIKLPILKEYDDRAEEEEESLPALTLSDPHHVIKPEDDKVRWFKEVFSEWRPPETQFNARYDEAFMKWYKSAMGKELEQLHASHAAVVAGRVRSRCVKPQSPTIQESDDGDEEE
mmetsp:Transcript_75078/g.119378  ORF Transcript_75078/g.119378 Transcript_75078/m.119378 type:complete len:169 (-) Transcript_75078:1000-1506(-)